CFLTLCRCEARPVIAHANLESRPSSQIDRCTPDVDLDRITAGRKRVLEQVSKDSLNGVEINVAMQVDTRGPLADHGIAAIAGCTQLGPGAAPYAGNVINILFQLDRRRVAADVLKEPMEPILRTLNGLDQLKRLRTIFHFQGQHLEVGLYQLQGVATFVG